LANSVALFARGRRYICCNCNRVIFKSRVRNRKDRLCPHCGHEMVADRSVAVAFGFGLCWSIVLVAITAAAEKFLPVTSTTTAGAGLAICAALACNKLFLSSQYFRTPEPVASVSRQMLAEGVAAFVIVVAGGTFLLR
jgi:DNA-directed RNA polymerase subunit RPC12/RpoP